MKCKKCGLEMMVMERRDDGSLVFVCINPKCGRYQERITAESKP